MRKLLIIFFCSVYLVQNTHANNLQLGPVTLDTINGNPYLKFNISWNNSWRVTSGPGNWDAVWIFVKRRDCSALDWRHANLAPQDTAHTAHTAGTPLFVDAYADKKGVMIYRATDGSGNISNTTIRLKLDSVPAGNYDYQVFGIEMVYIPQGSFYAGDGVSINTFRTGNTQNPFLITGESPLTFSTAPGNLFAGSSGSPTGNVPASYPKGYNSFYCMKYEISQGQYADFLNNLAQDAVSKRFNGTYASQNRYSIAGTWPSIMATSPNRACNWLSFKDLTAYLDWAALSPMTELEFEKTCRGAGNVPIENEFAWGGITVTDADSIISGTDGTHLESVGIGIVIGSGLANFGNDFVLGPLRCGFAAKSGSTRFESGSSFYGVMEMSGNLMERCYNLYFANFANGYLFNGSHGDGELTTSPNAGFANQGWPSEAGDYDAFELSSVALRGGAWTSPSPASDLKISDRFYFVSSVNNSDALGRSSFFGGRGVSRRQ